MRISTALAMLLGMLTLGLQTVASAPVPSGRSIVGSWMATPAPLPGSQFEQRTPRTPSLHTFTSNGAVLWSGAQPSSEVGGW